ncbi:hypothetical protein EYF80_053931 [Liparis tanakae]|uniref:Uncharacterized protein n=1 Tax=Liparis tanakae TaxID=230148 RepID=A0A4Z2F425_9TELE|nr:hypothetical protein EYF80_053931 [Liparis tanakae]
MRKCRPNLGFTPFLENTGAQEFLAECRFTAEQQQRRRRRSAGWKFHHRETGKGEEISPSGGDVFARR